MAEVVVVKCCFCIKNLTGVARIKCAECVAVICIQCFQFGSKGGPHQRGHDYEIWCDEEVQTLFNRLWARDEEQTLIQTVHRFKLGNWEEVTKVITKGGKKRVAADVTRHFQIYFVLSTLGQTAMKEKEWIERRDQFKDDVSKVIADPSGRELYYHAVIEALRTVKELPDIRDRDIVQKIDSLVRDYFLNLSRTERKRKASALGAPNFKPRAAANKEVFPYGESDDETWWDKMFKVPREKKEIDRYYEEENLCMEEKCMAEALQGDNCDLGGVLKMMKEVGLEDKGVLGDEFRELALSDCGIDDAEEVEKKQVTQPINLLKQHLEPEAKRHKMLPSEVSDRPHLSVDMKREVLMEAMIEDEAQLKLLEGKPSFMAKMGPRDDDSGPEEEAIQEESSCDEGQDYFEDEEEEQEEDDDLSDISSATQSDSDAAPAVFDYESYEARMREAGYQTDDLYSDWDEETREEVAAKLKDLTQRGIIIDSSEEGFEKVEGLDESAGEKGADRPRKARNFSRRLHTVSSEDTDEDDESIVSSDEESVEDSSTSEVVTDFENEPDKLDTLFGSNGMRRPKDPMEKKKIRTFKFYALGSDDEYHTVDEDAAELPMVQLSVGESRRRAIAKRIKARMADYYDFDPVADRYNAKIPRPCPSPRLEAEIAQFARWEFDRLNREGYKSRSVSQVSATPRASVTPALVDGDVDMDRTPEARFGDDFDPAVAQAPDESFHVDHPSFQQYLMERFLDVMNGSAKSPSSEGESFTDELGEQFLEYLGYPIGSDEDVDDEEEVEEDQQEVNEGEEYEDEEGEESSEEDEEVEDEAEHEEEAVQEEREPLADNVFMEEDEKPDIKPDVGKVVPKEEPVDHGYPAAAAPTTPAAPAAPVVPFVQREIKMEEPDDETKELPPFDPNGLTPSFIAGIEQASGIERVVKEEPLDEEEEQQQPAIPPKQPSEQPPSDHHEQPLAAARAPEDRESTDVSEAREPSEPKEPSGAAETEEESEEREDSDESEELVEQPPVNVDGTAYEDPEEDEDEEESDDALYQLAEEQTEEEDGAAGEIKEEEEAEENPDDWNDDEFHGAHCDCRNCKYDRGEKLHEEECMEEDEEPIGDVMDEEANGEEHENEREKEDEQEDDEVETESDEAEAILCVRDIQGLDFKCLCNECTRLRWSETHGEREHDLWKKITKSGMSLDEVKKMLRSHFVQEESEESSTESDNYYTDEASDPEHVCVKAAKITDTEWRLDLSSAESPIPVKRLPPLQRSEGSEDIPHEDPLSPSPPSTKDDDEVSQPTVESLEEQDQMEVDSSTRPSSSKSSQPATIASSSDRLSSKSSQPVTVFRTQSQFELEEGKFDREDEDMDKTPPMLQNDEKEEEEAPPVVVQPVEVPKTPIMVIKKVHARGRTNLKVETRPRTPQVPAEEKKEETKTEEMPPAPPPKKKKISKEFELLFKDIEIRKWEESKAGNLKERASKAVGTSREKYSRTGTQVNVSDSESEEDPRKKGKKSKRLDKATGSRNLVVSPVAPVHEDLPRSSRRIKKEKENKRKKSESPKKIKKKDDKKGKKRAAEPVESEKEVSSEEAEEAATDGKTPQRKRRKNKRVSMSKKERKAKWDKKVQNRKAREEKKVEEKKTVVRTVEFFEQHERTYFTNVYRRIAFDYEDHGFRNRVNFKSWINDIYNMGYSQERDDLEVEYYNEAEQIISRLNITNNEGSMPLDMENEIKLAKVDRYMRVLQERRALRNQAAEYESIPDFLQLCRRMNNERRKLKDIVKARAADEGLDGKLSNILAKDELCEMKAAKARLLKIRARTDKLKEIHASGATTLEGHESLARFKPRTKFGKNEEQKKVVERERSAMLVFDERIARRLERLSLAPGCPDDEKREPPAVAL